MTFYYGSLAEGLAYLESVAVERREDEDEDDSST